MCQKNSILLTEVLQTWNAKLFVMILTNWQIDVCEIRIFNRPWGKSNGGGHKVKEGKGQRWVSSIVLYYSINKQDHMGHIAHLSSRSEKLTGFSNLVLKFFIETFYRLYYYIFII